MRKSLLIGALALVIGGAGAAHAAEVADEAQERRLTQTTAECIAAFERSRASASCRHVDIAGITKGAGNGPQKWCRITARCTDAETGRQTRIEQDMTLSDVEEAEYCAAQIGIACEVERPEGDEEGDGDPIITR